MSEEKLILEAQFDRSLVREGGKSVRYLCLTVTAPPPVKSNTPRPPLNLALVVDASGSMGGAPLKAAKAAANGVIDGLKDSDFLSVVSFAEDVVVHLDRVKANNKRSARSSIEGIECRGMTNLSGGWLKGAECVASKMDKSPGYHNHVVLLSDGHANRGILEPDILEKHANELRKRHVFTSTVGIGDSYSSTQMEALAEFGGGRMHDAEVPQEIIEVVLGELSELSRCVVDNVELSLVCPPGVKLQNISRFPTVMNSNVLRTSLGSLGPSQQKLTVFRITTPKGDSGDTLQFIANATATSADSSRVLNSSTVVAALTFAQQHRNCGQSGNADVALKTARVWQAAVVRRAVEINRHENFDELEQFLDHEIFFFAKYCAGLPGTSQLVSELVQLRDIADRGWDERSRKDIHITTYQSIHGYKDLRSTQREHWSTRLKES